MRAVADVCATATQISKRLVNGDVPCFGTAVAVLMYHDSQHYVRHDSQHYVRLGDSMFKTYCCQQNVSQHIRHQYRHGIKLCTSSHTQRWLERPPDL